MTRPSRSNPNDAGTTPAARGKTRTSSATTKSASAKAKATTSAKTRAAARPASKKQQVIDQLAARSGATVERLQSITGWQPHTIRACLSMLRKSGMTIKADKQSDKPTRYSIIKPAKAAPDGDGTPTGARTSDGAAERDNRRAAAVSEAAS